MSEFQVQRLSDIRFRKSNIKAEKGIGLCPFLFYRKTSKNETKKIPPIDIVAETVFYTMSVYFLAAKVTKTRYTLTGALLDTLTRTVASVVLAGRMM